VVPAATLLFPFVQYDYDAGLAGETGATTLFAITNVSNEAQIVHITLWTDYSIAILDFNIVLTGYDVQTINIRDILRDGWLPYEGNGANISISVPSRATTSFSDRRSTVGSPQQLESAFRLLTPLRSHPPISSPSRYHRSTAPPHGTRRQTIMRPISRSMAARSPTSGTSSKRA